jgi:hypothetical protein
MIEPEQGEAGHGEHHIGIEDYPRISGRNVVCYNHFSDMGACHAKQQERGPHNGSSVHVEAPAEREKAYSRKTRAKADPAAKSV